MKLLWLAAWLLLIPGDLFAQTAADAGRPHTRLQLPAAETLASTQQPGDVRPTRDSLKNGMVIGAIVGGATLAAMTTYLCVAVGEEGDPPCWRGVLAVGALGAGVGAAAGAGIDAMFARGPSTLAPARTSVPEGRRIALTWRQRF